MATLNTTRDTKVLQRMRSRYLLGSVIVWASTLLALAVVLSGTSYFMQVLPILTGGIVWFVVIVPAALLAPHGLSPEETESQGRAP